MRIPPAAHPLPDELVERAREHAAGTRETVEPRDAATVVLLRPGGGPDGPEVYYLRRQGSMAFAAGMAVFPGGGVDPRDHDLADAAWAGPSPTSWAERLGTDESLARALVCAAVRETFEESGVLLAGASEDEVVADTTGEAWEADRVALESRSLAFSDLLERRGLVLRTDLLGLLDAWTTPVFEPRRYRTWFFTAALPAGQRTRDVSSESSSVAWIPALEAVRQADAGELALMPPTYLTSLAVGSLGTAEAVAADAARRAVAMHTPTVEERDGQHVLSVPAHLEGLLAEHRG